MSFNPKNPATLDLLLRRRSVKAKDMIAPGPSKEELIQIMQAAIRVADHGKLAPWRFIILTDGERGKLGVIIADALSSESDISDRVAEKMKDYGSQAPVCIIAIHSPKDHRAIPKWEMELSTGAACQNLLIAAHALGYVGQWLTSWGAYSPVVHKGIGLTEEEKIAGFIFLGSQDAEPSERPRPDISDVVKWGL